MTSEETTLTTVLNRASDIATSAIFDTDAIISIAPHTDNVLGSIRDGILAGLDAEGELTIAASSEEDGDHRIVFTLVGPRNTGLSRVLNASSLTSADVVAYGRDALAAVRNETPVNNG